MISKKALRRLLEARCNEARDPRRGRVRFVNEVRATLGLMEEVRDESTGQVEFVESVDEFGRPALAKSRAKPEEFSLRELAEAIGGEGFVDTYFNPQGGVDQITLIEAGAAIDPTAMININTFSLATAGLVEAKVLEKFQNPAFIGDQLVEVRPTKLNGEKMIGVGGIGDKAKERKPGQSHPRAAFGERWVETPELKEMALACELTQEIVFYDLTGQVLDTASSIGTELGYRRELDILDLILGVDNPYNYKGTAYDTYQVATPWINSHVNPLVDYNDVDESNALFRKMTDPETGKEILVFPRIILHSPENEMLWHNVMNATEIRETTNTNTVTLAPNPVTKYTRLSSVIYHNRLINGKSLSDANAKKTWFHGDFPQAFAWMEAWPLRTRQASANEYMMLDHGIIAAYFSNYRGIGAVKEPRHVVENKAA